MRPPPGPATNDRVVSLYAAARRLGAHVDTVHLLCLREGTAIEIDAGGARCILSSEICRLERALKAHRERPKLPRKRPRTAPNG